MSHTGIVISPPPATALSKLSPQRIKAKAARHPVYDPSSGEIHYPGGIILITRQLSVLLVLLAEAEGEVVPTERVPALTRPYGPYSEPGGRRRVMFRRLKKLLAPLGVEIEHRVGFGYGLRGQIELRAMPVEMPS